MPTPVPWRTCRGDTWRKPPGQGLVLLALCFPLCSDSKEFTCSVEDLGSIHGLGRSTGGRNGNPLQYSCLENPHGQRSLAGYSPWGPKASDTTKQQSTRLCSLQSGNDQHPCVRTSEEGVDVCHTCRYCVPCPVPGMPMFTSFNIPILQARKLRPREVKLLSIAWAGGHGGSKICTQHSGSRPWLLSSSARGLIQGAQRGLGTCLRSLGAHRGGCKTFGPLEFLTGPRPWGELVLRVPMQGSSGYKRLRAAGEAGARRTWNHQGVVLPLLNSAWEAQAAPPSRDPRVPRERARWPLDGTVTQQSGGRRRNRESGEAASPPPLAEPDGPVWASPLPALQPRIPRLTPLLP